MPLTMDNSPVEVGDKVHDIRFGAGKIVAADPGSETFVARFSRGVEFTYNQEGKRTQSEYPRTLFWHNPVAGAPPKDEQRWFECRRLTGEVIKSFRNIR